MGTTGIVEPSEKALTDTIYLEMKVLRDNGHSYCFVTPGNYGIDFLKEEMGIDLSWQLNAATISEKPWMTPGCWE